jgi:hypothetical protein
MPTTGIQRRPATIRTSGLTNIAAKRTIRRARGPNLIVLTEALVPELRIVSVLLMYLGRDWR